MSREVNSLHIVARWDLQKIYFKSAFKICETYRGLSVFSTFQVYSYSSQVKPKRYWQALLIGILKNA